VEAYESGTLKRLAVRPSFNASDAAWGDRSRKGDYFRNHDIIVINTRSLDVIANTSRLLEDKPGPRSVSFNGPRFHLDTTEKWVSWAGWEFYLNFERDMGSYFPIFMNTSHF
jgi:hypothetical protein